MKMTLKQTYTTLLLLIAALGGCQAGDNSKSNERYQVSKISPMLSGPPEDKIKAISMMEELAEKDNIYAQERLFTIFSLGDEVISDESIADYWAYRGAHNGSAHLSYMLSTSYALKGDFKMANMYLFLPTLFLGREKTEDESRSFDNANRIISMSCRADDCNFLESSKTGEQLARACAANKFKNCNDKFDKIKPSEIRFKPKFENFISDPTNPMICIEDYCPCDKSAGYGGVDDEICSQLVFGKKVEPEVLKMAAQSRKARSQN